MGNWPHMEGCRCNERGYCEQQEEYEEKRREEAQAWDGTPYAEGHEQVQAELAKGHREWAAMPLEDAWAVLDQEYEQWEAGDR